MNNCSESARELCRLKKLFKPSSLPVQELSSLSFPLFSTQPNQGQPNPTQPKLTTQHNTTLTLSIPYTHLTYPALTSATSIDPLLTLHESQQSNRRPSPDPQAGREEATRRLQTRESPVLDTGSWEGASGVLSTTLGVEPDVSTVEQWRGPPYPVSEPSAGNDKVGREEAVRRLRPRASPSSATTGSFGKKPWGATVHTLGGEI